VSYSKRARKGLAIGIFLFLSLVVFGTMYYVAYCACNTEVLADSNDGMGVDDSQESVAADPEPTIRRGPIEYVPDCDSNPVYKIRRGPIEMMPDYNPYLGVRRGPIEIVPDYNPYIGISRPPIMILPI